jgi:hypothetical protein
LEEAPDWGDRILSFELNETSAIEILNQESRDVQMECLVNVLLTAFADGVLDDGEKTRRYASAVAYLNDNYEGGELYFQDLNFTYQPVAGDVVIFPSGAPFRHEAKPVISGIKYSIANWW